MILSPSAMQHIETPRTILLSNEKSVCIKCKFVSTVMNLSKRLLRNIIETCFEEHQRWLIHDKPKYAKKYHSETLW